MNAALYSNLHATIIPANSVMMRVESDSTMMRSCACHKALTSPRRDVAVMLSHRGS